MKSFPLGDLRLVEKELKTDLGQDNIIFIGSSTDMWAEEVPHEWIKKILGVCNRFPENKYLFQSKNPQRFLLYPELDSKNIILGTTIETNRDMSNISKAGSFDARISSMRALLNVHPEASKIITIEPILDFDIDKLVSGIFLACPDWVNIGADSKGHGLSEPYRIKVDMLIEELKVFTKVKEKKNLYRLK